MWNEGIVLEDWLPKDGQGAPANSPAVALLIASDCLFQVEPTVPAPPRGFTSSRSGPQSSVVESGLAAGMVG